MICCYLSTSSGDPRLFIVRPILRDRSKTATKAGVIPPVSEADCSSIDDSFDTIFNYNVPSSDSTYHPDTVQIELNNILAQLQVDPDYDQLNVAHLQRWSLDNRLILCPSKQLNRIGDIKMYEQSDDTMNSTMWIWANQRRNYSADGTFVIPAINLRMLINQMCAEAITTIIGQAMYKYSNELAISCSFYRTREHYEHRPPRLHNCYTCQSIAKLRLIFDKIIFAQMFYREFICFQLFRNITKAELDEFFIKLYDELEVRFSDEDMSVCHTSSLTKYWCLCNCDILSKEYWLAMAQQSARSIKITLKHLGAKISLPFEPRECECESHISLTESAGLRNYPMNRVTAELFLGHNYGDSAEYLNGQFT